MAETSTLSMLNHQVKIYILGTSLEKSLSIQVKGIKSVVRVVLHVFVNFTVTVLTLNKHQSSAI